MPSSASASASSRRDPLQGPRPPPLRIDRSSHISKSRSSPVVVHVVSPKVVHTSPQEFMSTVQRLTGNANAKPSTPDSAKPAEDPDQTKAIPAIDDGDGCVGRRSPPVLYQFLI